MPESYIHDENEMNHNSVNNPCPCDEAGNGTVNESMFGKVVNRGRYTNRMTAFSLERNVRSSSFAFVNVSDCGFCRLTRLIWCPREIVKPAGTGNRKRSAAETEQSGKARH